MNAQETALPYRVASSAKDLAWSTLSGIENELRHPGDAKQRGSSSTQASESSNSRSSDLIRRRPGLSSRENSFRSQASAVASQAAEDEFDRFHERKEFDDTWRLSPTIASPASFPDFDRQKEDQHTRDQAPSIPLSISPSAIRLDSGYAPVAKESTKSEEIPADSDTMTSARSRAARRLDQIERHLQSNLAMQMLRQDTRLQSQDPKTSLNSQIQEAEVEQMFHQHERTPQSPGEQSRRQAAQENRMSQIHQPESQPRAPQQASDDNEEESPELHFHCPYYACHRNLRHATSNSNSSDRNQCVHVGCGFRAETSKDWAQHIKTSHHDLQGSSEVE